MLVKGLASASVPNICFTQINSAWKEGSIHHNQRVDFCCYDKSLISWVSVSVNTEMLYTLVKSKSLLSRYLSRRLHRDSMCQQILSASTTLQRIPFLSPEPSLVRVSHAEEPYTHIAFLLFCSLIEVSAAQWSLCVEPPQEAVCATLKGKRRRLLGSVVRCFLSMHGFLFGPFHKVSPNSWNHLESDKVTTKLHNSPKAEFAQLFALPHPVSWNWRQRRFLFQT